MSECIFCKILRGEAPCHRVHEDELSLAFLDIFPLAPGHTLVIPKRHAENLFEIDEASLLAVSRTAQQLAHAQRRALQPDGIMVMQLNGAAAGQTVFHHHTHLIPRDQGSALAFQPRVPSPDEELAAMAQQIREAIR
jgi:histidine triad (HIT) family protein